MNTYKNISDELRTYFSNHQIFKVLLPIDMAFVFGGVGIMAVNELVSLGGFLVSISYYMLLLGLLLAYANLHEKFMYIGFWGYAAIGAIDVLSAMFGKYYRYLDFHALLDVLVFGGLGYLVFKRTLGSGSSN